jgi:small multidrug resistance pump
VAFFVVDDHEFPRQEMIIEPFFPKQIGNQMPSTYIYLLFAIICETIGTMFLKASDGFSKPIPAIAALLGFIVALILLSKTLQTIPVGIVYALWSGIGIVLITFLGVILFKQNLDLPSYIGIGLILAGVVVLQLFSNAHV